MKKILFVCLVLALSSCTDAKRGKLFSLGDSASVTCWSGGRLIYDGFSTGKVSSEKNSDGYFFKDREMGKMIEVSGNCVIVYNPEESK